MAKTYKIKNKSFGIALWGAWVDPEIKHANKKQKLWILSAGFLLGIAIGSLAISISPLFVTNQHVMSFLLNFGFLSILINGLNAIPVFISSDSYQIVKIYSESKASLAIIIGGVTILLLMDYFSLYGFSQLTQSAAISLLIGDYGMALTLIFMFIMGKRLENYEPADKFSPGWHLDIEKLAILKVNKK